MTSSARSCQSIRDYLSLADHNAPKGAKGRRMLMRSLSRYLWWKTWLEQQRDEARRQQISKTGGSSKSTFQGQGAFSAALNRKDKVLSDKANNRRRTRGGAPTAMSARAAGKSANADIHVADESPNETDHVAAL